MPRPPAREITEVHRTPRGEIWAWLKDAYRDAEPAELEDYDAYEERLEQFAREHGAQLADDELEDGLARRMFLCDTDEAGRQRWGGRWEEARYGWVAHLLHEENSGWDQAAGARIPRTLSAQEWEAALRSRVARAADELLWNLPVSTGRRRPWLVATTRMPAEVVRALRGACTAQGLRLASTVLPDVLPTARGRWEDAARRLAEEACAQLPQ
jgi:hypothetical protein